MKKFDTRTYNVSDFIEWNDGGLLDLSPKFQRRAVWSEKARSYLIDTILRGKPMPKVLMMQTLNKGRNVRTVVDGQQRIRAIIGFIAGDFRVSRAHNRDYAGVAFDDLPEDVRDDFMQYEIGVDMLFNLEYEDILDVFARLNTYSVKLNPQELLNAQYLGYFKQAAYEAGFKYVRYWIESGVLTEKSVNRMAEAELASDLLGALIEGIQSKKTIPNFYKNYDDEDDVVADAAEKFDSVMSIIGEIYSPEELSGTNFSRVHLFYSLFCSIAHFKFGLVDLESPRVRITARNIGKIRAGLDDISAIFEEIIAGEIVPPSDAYQDFVEDSQRATTDAAVRVSRSDFICQVIHEVV